MVNLLLVEYEIMPNHAKLKLKPSIFVQSLNAETQLEVSVWRDFPVVAPPIRHSLFQMTKFKLDEYPW